MRVILLDYMSFYEKVIWSQFYEEVIGFFNWPNPSSHNMAMGSTQSLTQMSTKKFPGG
jgi:hypothetical protein